MLDKFGEEALTTKTEAARYLDAPINDSNSSVSSKGSFQGEIDHLRVSTLTGSTTLDTQRVNLYIENSDGKFGQVISAWTKESVTPGLKVVDLNTCKKEWPHLRSIDFPEVSYHDVVDILIG